MDLETIITNVVITALINNILIPSIRYLVRILFKTRRSINPHHSTIVNHPNTPFTYTGKGFGAHL
jgi:hypothetical protein